MSSGATSPDADAFNAVPTSQLETTPTPPGPAEPQAAPFHMQPSMPPFFANPFMSPFLPQQDGQHGPALQSVPGMVFSPAQYQEMMQQYFQQMMVASQYGQNIPFPMQFPGVRPASQASQSDNSTEAVTAGSKNSLSEPGIAHYDIPTATVAPIVPQSCVSNPLADLPETRERLQLNPNADASSSDVKEINSDSRKLDELTSESGSTGDELSMGERKTSQSEDERTTSLIKKQMTEIEKEITRRSHNKNIKKMDDRELAELIGASVGSISTVTSAVSTLEETNTFTPNFVPTSSVSQSGLPYTPPTTTTKPAPPKETLNQLRSSFNLHSSDAHSSAVTTVPSSQDLSSTTRIDGGDLSHTAVFPSVVSSLAQPVLAPQSFVNTFAQPNAAVPMENQPLPPNHTSPLSAEQMSALLTDQQAPETFSAAKVGEAGCPPVGGLAPPPAPTHPVQRSTNTSSSTKAGDWPEENKENGDDPVWVLRDSYLKRMQRDEEASQQEESWGEESVSALPAETNDVNEEEQETDRLITTEGQSTVPLKKSSKETMVHEPAVLIEGVLFRARYLGSTQMMCETRGSKAARMGQAQEAVARVKAPEGEIQPSTEIDLFISTEKIMVLNTDLQRISDTDVRQDILMDHALRTISYIADIGDLVVLMARRMSASDSDEQCNNVEGVKRSPKVICHVFESDEASFIAQSIGQAFQVAYVEFLRANGIDDPSYLRQIDYQEVLNSQELMGDELEMFARKETQKDVVVPKKNGEALGVVVVESGWGSMLPTVVLAHMNPAGPAARSNQLNIGDQIININGISLVGLPLSAAQTNIKNVKSATAVRLTVVSTPPVVEVRIRRPDTKYQLGFSVQNGVICSLLRGGIAERGGIRVGHRIIEINGTSVVAVAHDRIVNMLATAIGEIHMKTMPTSMYRLLTGQEIPQYI